MPLAVCPLVVCSAVQVEIFSVAALPSQRRKKGSLGWPSALHTHTGAVRPPGPDVSAASSIHEAVAELAAERKAKKKFSSSWAHHQLGSQTTTSDTLAAAGDARHAAHGRCSALGNQAFTPGHRSGPAGGLQPRQRVRYYAEKHPDRLVQRATLSSYA